MRYLICILALALVGCTTAPKAEYCEGLMLQVGIYVPYNGTIYGMQFLNFMSGKRIYNPTNMPEIISEHSVSNSTFGVDIIDKQYTHIR